MPLIVKGNTNIVSKQDAQKKAVETSEKVKENGLEKLSDSQKEIRQEILNAKRHREFMLRVQKQKAKSKAIKSQRFFFLFLVAKICTSSPLSG